MLPGLNDQVGINGQKVEIPQKSQILSELLCYEQSPMSPMSIEVLTSEDSNNLEVPSYFDPVLLHHPRILGQLRYLEEICEKPRDYFEVCEEREINPYMRKIVASWMLEVCEEQKCEDVVFPLSIVLLDTFLGCTQIKKEHLQLVASVCLLIATKTRQSTNFTPELLVWYTDNSVTPDAIKSWELVILSQLNWDINLLTPVDFVDYFLAKCPGMSTLDKSRDFNLIRKNVLTFIALCSTEPKFVGIKPSHIAASSIYLSFVKGSILPEGEVEILSQILSNLAGCSTDQVHQNANSIEQIITIEIAAMCKENEASKIPKIIEEQEPSHLKENFEPKTPTDIQDIKM